MLANLAHKSVEDRQAALEAEFAAKATATATAQATADAAQPKTGNTFAVAGLPAAASNVGRVVYCSNGSAGSPCAAISDGTDWKVVALGATVSAT